MTTTTCTDGWISEGSAWQTARGALPICRPSASSTGNSSPASSVSVVLLGVLAQVALACSLRVASSVSSANGMPQKIP